MNSKYIIIKIFILMVLLLQSMPVSSGEILYGYIENANQYNLVPLKSKAIEYLKNCKQPTDMFYFEYFNNLDLLIFSGNKIILEDIDKIKDAYINGVIKYKGTIHYGKKGYYRDDGFYDIKDWIKQLRQANYSLEVSTQ